MIVSVKCIYVYIQALSHNHAAAAVALPGAATLRRTMVGRCSKDVSCSYGAHGYPCMRTWLNLLSQSREAKKTKTRAQVYPYLHRTRDLPDMSSAVPNENRLRIDLTGKEFQVVQLHSSATSCHHCTHAYYHTQRTSCRACSGKSLTVMTMASSLPSGGDSTRSTDTCVL